MALDEYNAAETRDPYYPDTDSTRANARLWSIEKLALDLAAAGFVTLFKGAGTNPTTLAGYATSKLWLNSAAGVTDAPGVVRGYDGSGDATLVTSWPVLDLAGLRRHLSVYSRTETDALIASGLPPGFGSDDIANDSAVAGATVSDALETLDTAIGTKVSSSALGVSVATLDGGKLTTSQIPAILTSPFQFQGTWNAATNSPALASGVGTAGHLYRVAVAGTTALDGEASWAVGDELYFGGGIWNKLGASSGSTTITLPPSAQDTRITIIGQTTGGGSAKYQMAGTADGRVLIWGDTAAFGFNPVGDRYFAYDLERPWDTALYRPTAIYCAHNYAIVITDETLGNAYFIGDSTHGQGGQGGTAAVTRLTRIAQFATDAVKIASITTNGNRNTTEGFWFALTTAGTAYGCGYSGAQHVMGYGSATNLSTPRKLTLSDGTTPITGIDAITCDTAYTPVWLHLTNNKVLRWGAGTDGAHGNNSTTALQWPTYLETAVGSGVHRTDVAQVVTTGNSARAVSWLRTTAGKVESSGSRYHGNGDGAALLSAASNTFQPATGGIAALTVSKLVCGGGEYYDCVAITSTGTGYLCGYVASYGQLGNGSVTNLNTFTPFVGLPSGFSGALTNAVVAGGAAYTAIYLEATIGGTKAIAAIGYDGYYNTGKGTSGIAAAAQTWGLVRGVSGTLAAWSVFGTYVEYGIAVLNTENELRYAGPSDQGQGGVSGGQTTAIDILQPVRTGLPRLLKVPVLRGAYSAVTEYSYQDEVTDQGGTWRYIHATASTGNAPPTLPTTSNTYWRCVAEPGDAGFANIVFDFDGGTSALTTGMKCRIPISFDATIMSHTLIADTTGSIVLDVWKDTYANYPPTLADTIAAAAKPTLSAAQKATDSTLTGWTTTINAGDILLANIDSVSGITNAVLTLKVQRTT